MGLSVYNTKTIVVFMQLATIVHTRFCSYFCCSRGHDEYLSNSPNYDFPTYRQVVHECTEEFAQISQKIIDIEKKFTELDKTEVAGYIRKLQELEKEKLDTVSLWRRIAVSLDTFESYV